MRRILALVVLVVSAVLSQAQDVKYYRHIKTVSPSGAVTAVAGHKGQFVTRNGRACYESRPDGTALQYNGHLILESESGGLVTYSGRSYFGNSSFVFDDSRGYLNVRGSDGTVYVFQRQAAPAGCTASSYITPRPAPAPDVHVPVPSPGYVPTTPVSPSHDDVNRPGTRRQCDICHGSTDCQHCHGKGWIAGSRIGGSSRIECSLCKGSGKCIHCQGRGWTRN